MPLSSLSKPVIELLHIGQSQTEAHAREAIEEAGLGHDACVVQRSKWPGGRLSVGGRSLGSYPKGAHALRARRISAWSSGYMG